ncbi:hypothetical protein PENTCL1PPCAC_29902, partial [Pristionchus entomophagus]
LPSADQQIADGLTVVATGFGYAGPNSTRDNFRLRETSMPVVSIDECRSRFEVGLKKMAQSAQDEMRDTLQLRGVICAGSSDHKGDSGGPLVVKATDRSRYTQDTNENKVFRVIFHSFHPDSFLCYRNIFHNNFEFF